MKMNIAYAALVGTTLLGSPALAQQSGGAGQLPAPAGQAAQTQSNGQAAGAGQFIDKQPADEWRAPKLVGVDVYGADNKKIGTIKDLLMNHDGSVQAVVIGVGGFLGIGAKEVAVPFQSVKWQMESRALPSQSSTPPGGAPLAPAGNTPSGNTPPPQPTPKMTNPAEAEASQGYPDKAVIDMTMAQLKSAPAFQYAQNPQSAAAQRPQPQPSKP
ncbi:MAG TPA: PRC-barrel domain-containing protein [Roseiarcus sp.]|jgi:sporulation protein YlmC with PRC-barrel domain|nr:PRC-barrel domain-containing protein [Roseiarcus sp.]